MMELSMKKNKSFPIVLISILILVFTGLFCCCGIDTSNIAGSTSQVYQQEEAEDVDEYDEELEDDEDIEDSEDLTEESLDEEEPTVTYVLNTNTQKFHYPDCRSVKQMKDKNKLVEETTREDLIDRGYSPCGNCNP